MADRAELRAAATDILDKWMDNGNRSPTATLARQAIALARAYLAEHPADSDEPVSEEWLRSVGFTMPGSQWYFHAPNSMDSVDIVKWAGGFNLRLHDGAPVRTRRDVRDLCRALGIPLTDPPTEQEPTA